MAAAGPRRRTRRPTVLPPAHAPRRGSGDEGAAIVEFALVSVLLFSLVFGIISFGVLLSFRQDLTRAAAEGARAGAVAVPATDALSRARTATDEAVVAAGETCGRNGMTCDVAVRDCNDPAVGNNGNQPADPDCVFVELTFDNDHHPKLPEVPLISAFLPDTIEARSVARTN